MPSRKWQMITSTSNAQVKNVVSLQKKSKLRKEQKEFVVEGQKMVLETPVDRLVKVYVSQTFKESYPSVCKKVEEKLETVSDNVFMQMSDTKTPQGILAIVKMKEYDIETIINHENPFIVILENIQDPGNLGTILRTAEGAGVTGVIMSDNTADIYNPKVIRSTMGSLYRVPFVYVKDFPEMLRNLKAKKITLNAAHLEGSCDYTEGDYRKATAFVIGNEGNGLTKETTDACDNKVRISMEGNVESLNAAIATAILLFEAKRQKTQN